MPFANAVNNPRSGEGTGFLGALDTGEQTQSKGFYSAINSSKKNAVDLDSVDGLLKLAKQKGLIGETAEITEDDSLSFLQRLSSGLGALNPAEAIARDYEGTQNFLTAYPTTVLQGIASALTGNDYGEQTKKRYFGDLVKDIGIENKYAQFGVGLIGDILLDPSTYVGGTLMRGAIKGASAGAKIGIRGVAKASPEAAESLLQAGRALKDAGGELFVHGYGASKVTTEGTEKGLAEGLLEFEGKKMNVQAALALSNAKRYGNDLLTDNQWEEFLGHIFAGKTAEFNYFDTVTDEMLEAFNKKFPDAKFPMKDMGAMKKTLTEKLGREATDVEVRSAVRQQTINRIESVTTTIPKKIGKLQELRNKLAQPFIEGDLIGLRQTVAELREELAALIPTTVTKVAKAKPFMATEEQANIALMNALSMEKNQYTKTILDLQARIAAIEKGTIEPAMKNVTKQVGKVALTPEELIQKAMRKVDPDLKIKDQIVEITDKITHLANEMLAKQRVLESVLAGKQIAKERIENAFKTGDFKSLPDELAEALRPTISDPVVEKALAERLARNAQLAEKAGIEDPFVMYAPSIAKEVPERSRITEFFRGTSGLKVGSKDYTKEFRNLLKDEDLIKDRNLFLRVEDEIATNKVTQEFLQSTVDDYGKPLSEFKTELEAKAAGYRMLKEKGMFGKEIGYVNEADWKFLNSHMNNNYKAFDAIAKATGFDALTSLFKRSVTGLFAPFHVRNFASGEMQNFELLGKVAQAPKVQAGGMRLANKISRGAFSEITDPFDLDMVFGKRAKSFGEETIELAGKQWKLDEIGLAIERRFGGSSRYNVDYNSITSDASKLIDSDVWSKETLRGWGRQFLKGKEGKTVGEKVTKEISGITSGLLGENNPLFKQAQAIGGFIEMQQKSKLVLGALEKGLSLEEALGMAAKGGFDYRALTMFESKIMRRIIPFYAFNRKNAELQLRVLGENPQRINQIIRTVENIQRPFESTLTEKEKENLPAYLKEYMSVSVGRTSKGVPQFVRNFGTPIEAFTSLVKFKAEGKGTIERTFLSTLSMVNPYIKVPIEIGIQKDSFRQRDLKDVYTATEYESFVDTAVGDYLRLKAVTKKDYATGMQRTTYVADPERLLVARSLFTSRGTTYFNNVFNGDITGFFKVMDLVSGIRVAEVDVDRNAGFTERRKQEELGNLLRRNGIVSEFNKLFIPKQ